MLGNGGLDDREGMAFYVLCADLVNVMGGGECIGCKGGENMWFPTTEKCNRIKRSFKHQCDHFCNSSGLRKSVVK